MLFANRTSKWAVLHPLSGLIQVGCVAPFVGLEKDPCGHDPGCTVQRCDLPVLAVCVFVDVDFRIAAAGVTKPCISDLRLLCFVVGRFIGGIIDAMQLANVLGAGSQH